MPADDCGVAQAMGVLGDAWSVLVLRDLARGHTRFEPLLTESGISRKVLAARLRALVEADVVVRVAYQDRPVRHDYLLTDRGRALLPVLAARCRSGVTRGCSVTARRGRMPARAAPRRSGCIGWSAPVCRSCPTTRSVPPAHPG